VKPSKHELPAFKYPAEDEPFVRRFGAALLLHWSELPEDWRAKLLAEAGEVWDREFHIPQIGKKLELFVKRAGAPRKPVTPAGEK
jgi:hypothetical protein